MYTFILSFEDDYLKTIKTRKLLGGHYVSRKFELLVIETKNIALYPDTLHRMYKLPDSDIRIHLNVPIAPDVMFWACPVRDKINAMIYIEG